MAEYVEFYLTGNPPLLPAGVALVTAHAQKMFDPDKLAEILYEPEVPWFKIIGSTSHQNEIFTELQSYIEKTFKDRIMPICEDIPESSSDQDGNDEPRADVELIVENPPAIPWGKYLHRQWPTSESYNEYKFPETLDNFPHKLAWRDIESVEGLSVSEVLSTYSFLWQHLPHEPTIRTIADLTRCEITHNMRGDLVYIGSESPENLVAASRKLGNLLGCHKTYTTPITHLVFPETIEAYKLSMKWLTHIGLDKLTYAKALLGPVMEPEPLTHAATVRINATYDGGRKVQEKTIYPEVDIRAKNFRPCFAPFIDFKYPTKRRGAPPIPKHGHSSSSDSASLRDISPSEAGSTCSDGESDEHYSLASVRPNPKDEIIVQLHSDNGELVVSHVECRRENLLIGVDTDVMHRESPSKNSMTPADVVAIWMSGVEDVNVSKQLKPHSPLITKEEQIPTGKHLIDLGSATHELSELKLGINDETNQQPSSQPNCFLQAEPTDRPSTPKTEVLNDKACLLDSESPAKFNYGMFAELTLDSCEQDQVSHPNPPPHEPGQGYEGHLMDHWEAPIPSIPALMEMADLEPGGGSSHVYSSGIAVLGGAGQTHELTPVFSKPNNDEQELFCSLPLEARVPNDKGYSTHSVKTKKEEGSNLDLPESRQQCNGKNVAMKRVKEGPCNNGKTDRTKFHKSQGAIINSRHHQTEPSTSKNPTKIDSPTKRPVYGTGELAEENQKKTRKVIPGMDIQPTEPTRQSLRNPPGMARCIRNIEQQVKEVFALLQVVPGDVKLQVRLGRISMHGISSSLINVGSGPSWRHEEIVDTVSHPNVSTQFHTILTTNGAEADSMPEMVLSKGEPWKLYRKKVYYDFVCQYKNSKDFMVVEVDASTFVHSCKPLRQDLLGIYIHCAKRAWDIQILATRVSEDSIPKGFQSFAEALVKSLNISTTDKDQIRIEAEKDVTSKWHIKDVSIRHVAQYRKEPKSPNYLCISMTRAVTREGDRSSYQGSTTTAQAPGKGPMSQWFEAWFGSRILDRYTHQNKGLEFGEKTSWTSEQLVNEGAIRGVCEPALRMITQMDHVGQSNRGQQGVGAIRNSHTSPIALGKEEPFW